jgi:hypothetical protein
MTYGDHIDFFDREIAALGQRPMALTLPQIIHALDTDGAAETDAACRAFAAALEWPPMADDVRLQVCLRLHCARWWCVDMAEEDADGETGKGFLESLLIEYWRDVGRVDWIHAHFVKEWAERNFPGSTEPPTKPGDE